MISKELLSEVLGQVYIDATRSIKDENKHFAIGNKHVFLGDKGFNHWNDSINIYELAYKCKEWALIRGYSLLSGKPIVRGEEGTQVFNYWYKCYIWEIDENSIDSPTQNTKIETNSETEPEAVFKACEYVLKELNEKIK